MLGHLEAANKDANGSLLRLALKLATGAGKTTVMAMLIAWQTVNFVRRSGSKHFTKGFLIVTPGLTIKDRLRVLHHRALRFLRHCSRVASGWLAGRCSGSGSTNFVPIGIRLWSESSLPCIGAHDLACRGLG
jgi:hypothetical protein